MPANLHHSSRNAVLRLLSVLAVLGLTLSAASLTTASPPAGAGDGTTAAYPGPANSATLEPATSTATVAATANPGAAASDTSAADVTSATHRPTTGDTPTSGTAAPGEVVTGTAAVSTTATAAPPTAPPAVTVTQAQPTPTAVYPPIAMTTGVPRFEAGACDFVDLPGGAVDGKDVKCGQLIVPEEHADPDSPTIQLAVVILPAQALRPQADPIIFNQGGPGFGSIDTYLPLLYKSTFRARRDVILFDQRGTGHSNPLLSCPEVIDEAIATLNQNLSAADADAKGNAAALACRDRLVHSGVNLSAFNSQESAADIEDLRVALGYRQVNLYGVSYGSLLVLDTMRAFPGSVRSAILDGVVPPQINANTAVPVSADRAFKELFKACAADAICNTAYPSLEDTFYNVVAKLDTDPAAIQVTNPANGQRYPAVLNGDGFISAIFQAMYDSSVLPAIPELIRRANNGDFTALEPIVAAISLDPSFMPAMYWSVICAEDADFEPSFLTYPGVRPELARDQAVNNQSIKDLCQAWKVRDLAPILGAPVTSTVPTLILNGRFDPITPPSNGLLASQTLSNSTVITVPTTAHGAFPAGGQCINQIMDTFLASPQLAVDTRCLAALPAITWVTSANLINFSIIQTINDLLARKPSLLLGALALVLSTLALLSGLIVFPIAFIIKRGAKPPDELASLDPAAFKGADPAALAGGAQAAAMALKPPEVSTGMLLGLAPWLAVLAGLLPVAFGAAFYYTVWPLVTANNGILLLGIPGQLDWVFALPLVNAVIVFLLLVATLLGLVSKDWSGRRKLYFLFLSLSGIVLVAALFFVGLLTALWGQVWALIRGLINA